MGENPGVPHVAHLRPVPAADAELDRATLAAACAGEDWARHAVLRRYERPVWSLVCRILGRAGRHGVAQDVAQDALLGVLRGLPRYDLDHRATLTTWVLTIAARTAISELRRGRGDAAPLTECDLVALERPDAALERERLGAAITEAVEHLSPEIRAAFVLRAFHELSYEEIAAILELDLGTVKSRLWRARAALQRRLSEVHRDR